MPLQPNITSVRLDSLFTHGHFTLLETETLRMLRHKEEYSEDEIIAALLYLGYVEVLSGRIDKAKQDFEDILKIRPVFRLDRVYTPPSIYKVFEQVCDEFQDEAEIPPPDSEINLEYLKYNLLLPGCGHVLKKQNMRGVTWFSLQTITLAAFFYANEKKKNAKEEYYNNLDLMKFSNKYNEYNKWHKYSIFWGVSTIAVYIASQVDFINMNRNLNIEPVNTNDDMDLGVKVSWTFH